MAKKRKLDIRGSLKVGDRLLFEPLPNRTWTVNEDHDMRVASWHIADLFLGPDDGSDKRNMMECLVIEVMKESFSETEGRDPVFGDIDPENPPPDYRPARPRRRR